MDNKDKIILSLFDFTGNWSRPYKNAGYNVIQVDIQHGTDVMTWDYKTLSSAYGILAAVPCTDFAISGARHFAKKDADGTTEKSIALVHKTLEIINYFNPVFWVIENPMSRIHKCVPELGAVKYKFNPCDFAGSDDDRYNKTTWLWGKFNEPVKHRLEPLSRDCPLWRKYGGKSLKTKNARSATPSGFAQAFFEANQ